MKLYLNGTLLLALSLLSVNTFSSEVSPSGLVKLDFKNPSTICSKVKNPARAFVTSGYVGKITDSGSSIEFDYQVIDGACINGKYIPFTGKVLVYNGFDLSTSKGLFSGVKTEDLVNVRDNSYQVSAGADSADIQADGSVVLSRKNIHLRPCYDTQADQIFSGNTNCSVDSQGNNREGKTVSMHKYHFTINKKLLDKVLSKKESLKINYAFNFDTVRDWNKNSITVYSNYIQFSVMKDVNNNFQFIF